MAKVAVAAPVALPASLDSPNVLVDSTVHNNAPHTTPKHLESQEKALEPVAKNAHDPHILPTFSRSQSPILYLPPLLSSLPPGVIVPQPPADSPAFSSPTVPPLHRALHHFRPLTEDYATTPYAEAFNWDELELPADEEREWYCVVFRSKRKEGSDGGPLYEADKKAHEEAVQNGGVCPRRVICFRNPMTDDILLHSAAGIDKRSTTPSWTTGCSPSVGLATLQAINPEPLLGNVHDTPAGAVTPPRFGGAEGSRSSY
ncbi:hypothetical protein NUW54_g12926 [Trametes sanguinea]|uniref:Uncharacterized protein n=1 Tax=Trametes sanguinea TaxID=158606 RepID=A0ACC1MRZ9_9APHY|nr:hypothetical protein NUW54_g12926 [Trametes sanguinea]